MGLADTRRRRGLQAIADTDEEQRREEEADGVEPVHAARANGDDTGGGEDRADEGREVLGSLHQPVPGHERILTEEVRQRRVARRPEERGGETRESTDGADPGRAVDERKRRERGDSAEVGEDHHPLPGPAIDQGADGDAENDSGGQLAEEKRCYPDG